MRKTLIILSLLGLAACATPREACISDATRELNRINGFIAETEANIARGYGIAERQEIVTRQDICVITNADGSESRFICEKQEVVTLEEPIALDLNAERAKLNSLREQRAVLERQSQAGIQACIAAYPEE